MTAIFGYISQSPKLAILATDSTIQTKNGNEIGDKMFYLFNRFFISAAGPNVLPEAMTLIYDHQKFDNCIKPKNISEFFSMLKSAYEIKLKHFKRDSSPEYQNINKIQSGIIYDQDEHIMYKFTFGHPFSDNEWEKKENINQIKNGTIREGLYTLFPKDTYPDLEIIDDLEKIKSHIAREFKMLDIKTSTQFNATIGNVGSFLLVSQQNFNFISTFQNYVEYLENYEKSYDLCE